MDNGYNNQFNQPQYQQVNCNQINQAHAGYNPYGQPQMQMDYNGYDWNQPANVKKKFITLSLILGLLGSITMLVGLIMPAIDFSHFHSEVDIQYNLFKIGKNVGLISAMWNVIPYAILVGIIILAILSFVKIPILKILPVVLIVCMFFLMLIDMGNVTQWAIDVLNKFDIKLEVDVTTREIFSALMPGIYIMVVGLVISIVSCFVKIKEK